MGMRWVFGDESYMSERENIPADEQPTTPATGEPLTDTQTVAEKTSEEPVPQGTADAKPVPGGLKDKTEVKSEPEAGTILATRSRTHGVNIDIPVGTRLNMAFLRQKETYTVELLGFSLYEYLIVRLPRLSALYNRLVPHETISMRYVLEGTVYAFITEVISSVTRPGFMLFCSYPSSLEQIELRRYQRLGCLLPALIRSAHGEYRCILQDLSHGGAKLIVETKRNDGLRQIEVGANLQLDFTLFIGKSEAPTPAVVRSINIEGTRVNLGIQFLDMPEDLCQELDVYLDALSHLR